METVSKYSLNPLATCFIPSSMKYQSISSHVFPIHSYESSVNGLYGGKRGLLQTFRNEQTVTEYFEVTDGVKEVLSNPVEKKTVQEEPFVTTEELKEIFSNTVKQEVVTENPFVSTEEAKEIFSNTVKQEVVTENPFVSTEEAKEMFSNIVKEEVVTEISFVSTEEAKEIFSNTVKKEVVTEEPFLTTKGIHPTAHEMIGKEIPEKLNAEEISEKRSKKRIGSEVTSLTELAKQPPNRAFMGIISELLKGGTKTLLTLLPFTIRSMLIIEFCCWVGVNAITVDLTLSSNLFSVLKPNCNAITYPKKSKNTKIEAKNTNDKAKSNECRCPPMFGWIVPFQFFGNPLNLADTCCKEYVHTSYVDESSRQPQKTDHITLDESSDVNDEAITLEQCSSELKAVIKDVCDSLSSSYEQGGEVSSQAEVSETRKRPVWKTETKNEVEMKLSGVEISDDGFHPLLREIASEDTDDTEIASIQKLLGEAFSLHKKDSPLEILPSQSVCNPPCSIWCNKVPPPAKDTYKRFLKKLDSESTVHPPKTDVKKVIKKPLYKRCFSADDTPKSSDHDKMPLLSASSFESRERLLLLRKDPIAFIKQSSTLSSKGSNRKSRFNFSVASEQVSTKDYSNESGSDKWSLYDGSDSMWQPLPDCIPSNDNAQKLSHRRARDMRRQKSVC